MTDPHPLPESPAELAAERERFEAWMTTQGYEMVPRICSAGSPSEGEYANSFWQAHWDVWLAAIASIQARPVEGWISVEDRLPEVGSWVNVLVDRNEGDYFDRMHGRPRFEVFGAQLRWIDEEGYASWQRWVMPDGGPMGSLRMVTHWMPLPAAPTKDTP